MTPEATQQHPRRHITRSLLFAAGGLFLTAAALAVVQPPAPPELVFQARQTLDLPPLNAKASHHSAKPYIAATRIRRGDTVADLLNRLGVNENGLLAFLTHDENARSIYKLYPGRTVQAALDDQGRMVWLRYSHTPGATAKSGVNSAWLEVRPTTDGYSARERTSAATLETRIAEGEISSSLFGAADQARIPDAIVLEMVDILGSRIDFLKDLRKGDRFRIVYDAYMHDGEEVGTGHVRALEFINRGKTYSAVWFQNGQAGTGGYYDFSGASLKGAFLRTAIKFTRISSGFGMRMHPIHNHWTGHKGVDYAAPSGTPIHATADGTVEFIGKQNGYGNVIILKNFGKYSTLYAHQSRFAQGLKKGDHVQQGQLIGYVGSTGWATGPHLHYEFRIDNRPVDPLSVDLPVARTLDAADRQAFQTVVARYQPQIKLMARLQDSRIQIAQQ